MMKVSDDAEPGTQFFMTIKDLLVQESEEGDNLWETMDMTLDVMIKG